ncbi:type I secretion system permease/ATPase [Arvimicrobium flavum]|uniref:type I secretion system permease/ATPase n=1 Tax=Arvimicrobium flavum TaxID=3393320 RepID=UPI00237AD6E1|nr:type I secretion system permease/ATPase [Mesorhizobium shangrilense]
MDRLRRASQQGWASLSLGVRRARAAIADASTAMKDRTTAAFAEIRAALRKLLKRRGEEGVRRLRWRDTAQAGTAIEQAFRLCRPSLAMIFGLSFFVNLLALTVPLYLLHVYDHVLASLSIDTLVMLTLIVIVALAVHSMLEGLRRAMLTKIGGWLDDSLQAPVLTSAVQAAMRGDAASAAQAWRDLASLRTFFGGSACTALFDLPWTPIFLLTMFLIHPLLGAIGLLASFVLLGLAALNERVTRKPFARSSSAWVESQHRFESLMRNVEAIGAMGMLPGVARLLQRDQADAREAQLVATSRGSAIQAVARFVRLLAQVIIMACAAWLVIKHDVSPAAIFATTILLGRSLGPVEGAIGTWKAVSGLRLSYGRLRKLMAAAPPAVAGMQLPQPRGELAVEQVTFMPTGADRPAVNRVSFVLEPGEVLGVIGPSGAGKSTLGRLIAGAVSPTTGHVRLDSADIAIWLASGGQRYLGYLPQDIELFGGSVRDNIARLQETSSEKVIAAANMVGLHELIMRLPQGYDTDIGEGGRRLSGGQRQRLGLARAFFGYPRLIVLDEPNASLDAEGEEALRQAIDEVRAKGSTIVVIAQRLGILSMVDKILVLDNGRLDAFGSRSDIAGKIRAGRTSLPARRQVITATSSVRQVERDGRKLTIATNGGIKREEPEWAGS